MGCKWKCGVGAGCIIHMYCLGIMFYLYTRSKILIFRGKEIAFYMYRMTCNSKSPRTILKEFETSIALHLPFPLPCLYTWSYWWFYFTVEMNKKDLNEFKAFTSFWFTVTIFAPRFCTPVAIFQMLLSGDKLSQITIFYINQSYLKYVPLRILILWWR